MKPKTAYLVDRKGEVHGTHELYDRHPQRAVDHLNPGIRAATDGAYQYTLAAPEKDDFLTHIERIFETGE